MTSIVFLKYLYIFVQFFEVITTQFNLYNYGKFRFD